MPRWNFVHAWDESEYGILCILKDTYSLGAAHLEMLLLVL